MSMIVALQCRLAASGADDNMWTDVQTWAVAVTESLPGRDVSYFASEPGDYRLYVKNFGSGICQARVWEG
jgi:hypothetical protein